MLRPDSNDGSSETSSSKPTPTPAFDTGRKSDVLRNDLDDSSNFDIKWEPGLLDQDLRVSVLKQRFLRSTGAEQEAEFNAKKRSHLSTANVTADMWNRETPDEE